MMMPICIVFGLTSGLTKPGIEPGFIASVTETLPYRPGIIDQVAIILQSVCLYWSRIWPSYGGTFIVFCYHILIFISWAVVESAFDFRFTSKPMLQMSFGLKQNSSPGQYSLGERLIFTFVYLKKNL